MTKHAEIKYRGAIIYDGPVQPGTITDPAWWTLPRRLWIRCTPWGRRDMRDRLWDLTAQQTWAALGDAARDRYLDSVQSESVASSVWDQVRAPVRDALDHPAVADDPFPSEDA